MKNKERLTHNKPEEITIKVVHEHFYRYEPKPKLSLASKIRLRLSAFGWGRSKAKGLPAEIPKDRRLEYLANQIDKLGGMPGRKDVTEIEMRPGDLLKNIQSKGERIRKKLGLEDINLSC